MQGMGFTTLIGRHGSQQVPGVLEEGIEAAEGPKGLGQHRQGNFAEESFVPRWQGTVGIWAGPN